MEDQQGALLTSLRGPVYPLLLAVGGRGSDETVLALGRALGPELDVDPIVLLLVGLHLDCFLRPRPLYIGPARLLSLSLLRRRYRERSPSPRGLGAAAVAAVTVTVAVAAAAAAAATAAAAAAAATATANAAATAAAVTATVADAAVAAAATASGVLDRGPPSAAAPFSAPALPAAAHRRPRSYSRARRSRRRYCY
jgi:hypothetical protein